MEEKLERKVNRMLNGLSNEEAEEVAVTIMAQLMAKKTYIEDDESYVFKVFEQMCIAADAYAKSHAGMIAMAKVFTQKKKDDESASSKDS